MDAEDTSGATPPILSIWAEERRATPCVRPRLGPPLLLPLLLRLGWRWLCRPGLLLLLLLLLLRLGWRRICNPGLLLQRLLGRGGWSRPDNTARCFLLGPELRWNLPCPNPLLGLEELHLEHVLLCKENHVARPQRMEPCAPKVGPVRKRSSSLKKKAFLHGPGKKRRS